MGLCLIYVQSEINGLIISKNRINLSENAMSEMHILIKKLPSFVSNNRSTVNVYHFY